MLNAGQHMLLTVVIVAAIAVSACTSSPREAAPREAAAGSGADTVTLAVEGMT